MNNEKRTTVALLWGGRGHERDVSEKGKDNILPLIDRTIYDPLPIFIDQEGRFSHNGQELILEKGGFYCKKTAESYAVDCAFPLLHGDYGEDGIIQGALDCSDIPYVGCDVSAGAVCRDKSFVKSIAKGLGVPSLPHILLFRSEGTSYAIRRAEREIGYPMFIKPARLGSSVGVAPAEDRQMLTSALCKAFSLSERVIIEPYLKTKRELECGYLALNSKELFTFPGEILINGTYGYDEKYVAGGVKTSLRADLTDSITQEVREYSRRIVRALGVRDISRIDFFLSDGKLYFNEINTMPGFTAGSLYPAMIEASGISKKELISGLIERALSRR